MKIEVYNGSNGGQTYPFPNAVRFSKEKQYFGFGVLPMATDGGFEDYIMYRRETYSYVHFRFLIFAVEWGVK